MEAPFVYGRIADKQNFTDRKDEVALLSQNFSSLINTVIISPRRWGKTSLVNKCARLLSEKNKDILVCQVDIFNCRTEEQFYTAYANALMRVSTSAWEEFVAGVKKYLGRMAPVVSLSEGSQSYELSFGISFKENRLSYDEILDLPQQIAKDKGKKIIVCIDEFQNINEYEDSLAFQRKLRAHWQTHTSVCYCLYGSKRHMLLDIFNDYSMPFYKFGDILFLQKIKREDWITFISKRFADTGKQISDELCGMIADKMKNHPYYTQQLSQQTWLRTLDVCSEEIVAEAFNSLIGQLSLLFTNIIDSLTSRQISFLIAVADGIVNFSSKDVLKQYQLGTSANIKNLRKATLEKDLIDILPGNVIEIQDPAFEYWLKNGYQASAK
ncbi:MULTISPECIES: P-loop NTPase fold protein [unclassified Parabacteroides]|uniref:AAA family ATPase n=1 Tax=unclassified Parabacteroides TaxID=2649774 RepID=UPI000F000A53|nr:MULTISPECIES: P-loop NTPase fold protein [unclassified Parabacteroides]RHO73269.1 ATPase [Parabacteroides sp. AF48-14]RHR60492.1 ATPase [Parabacteroides sp. AF17-28]